jgi:uncharacterized protein
MKKICLFAAFVVCFCLHAQQKNFIDVPYLETRAEVDTIITPERIYMTVMLSEANTRNKKSVEELEQSMQKVLQQAGIDVQKDVKLLDFSSRFKQYFLKGQDVLKIKMFSVLVRNAVTAGNVLQKLEDADISNVSIASVEYSKAEELQLALKGVAVQKALKQAAALTQPAGQKVGKMLFITDIFDENLAANQGNAPIRIRGASSVNIYGSRAAEPMVVEFEHIEFKAVVKVAFAIE